MHYLLLPSVPLAEFHMFNGHVWDQSRSRNFRSTIDLLITQYTNTLGTAAFVVARTRRARFAPANLSLDYCGIIIIIIIPSVHLSFAPTELQINQEMLIVQNDVITVVTTLNIFKKNKNIYPRLNEEVKRDLSFGLSEKFPFYSGTSEDIQGGDGYCCLTLSVL